MCRPGILFLVVVMAWKCSVCSALSAGDLVCKDCFEAQAGKRRGQANKLQMTLVEARARSATVLEARKGLLRRNRVAETSAAEADELRDAILHVTKEIANDRLQLAALSFSVSESTLTLEAGRAALEEAKRKRSAVAHVVSQGLADHAGECHKVLRRHRLQKVLQLFLLLPVEASLPRKDSNDGSQGGRMSIGLRGSGISTIAGLPLPNSGDYNAVPDDVVISALQLVARLVDTLAFYLKTTLPHPLQAGTEVGRAFAAVAPTEGAEQYPLCPMRKVAEAYASDRAGVLGGGGSVCMADSAFSTALDLLRHDVVALCVEAAEVPVGRLWPAEALLLNLWELHHHCAEELKNDIIAASARTTISSTSIPTPSDIAPRLPLPQDLPGPPSPPLCATAAPVNVHVPTVAAGMGIAHKPMINLDDADYEFVSVN